MKKNSKKIALIGLAASVLLGTAGCGNNEPVVTYGPPVTSGETETEITEESTEEVTENEAETEDTTDN
jgi:hypothetical protein